jgi:hypothetical protein
VTASIWPADLPCRLQRDGYNETLPDGRAFAKMSAGPSKSRLLTSAAVRPVQGSLILSFAERATLDRFWLEDLRRGSRAFYFPDQFLDGLPMGVEAEGEIVGALADADHTVIVMDAWWLCRFAEGGIQYSRRSPKRWQASFTFEVLP